MSYSYQDPRMTAASAQCVSSPLPYTSVLHVLCLPCPGLCAASISPAFSPFSPGFMAQPIHTPTRAACLKIDTRSGVCCPPLMFCFAKICKRCVPMHDSILAKRCAGSLICRTFGCRAFESCGCAHRWHSQRHLPHCRRPPYRQVIFWLLCYEE